MQEPEFINFLQRLNSYFGKKDGADKTRNNLHFQKVRFIPGEQMLFDIFDIITDEYEYFPRNLPKAMRKAWDQWKAANPNKLKQTGNDLHPGCQYCTRGWIHFIVYSKEPYKKTGYLFPYRHVSICAHCRGNDYSKLPKHTVGQIQQMGGEIY